MTKSIPKDLDLARCAFNAFYEDKGLQIHFEDTSMNYQMRWVRAARAVAQGQRAYSRKPNGSYAVALDAKQKADTLTRDESPLEKKRRRSREWYARNKKKAAARSKARYHAKRAGE